MFYQCNSIILLPKLKNALMAISECGRKKLRACYEISSKRTHFHKKIPDKYNTDPVFDKIRLIILFLYFKV